MSWFTEVLFLIPNWSWFVIIVGIFCLLMAIVIITCVKKPKTDDEPEPVLMDGEAAAETDVKKTVADERKEEAKETAEDKEIKAEKVEEPVYAEPEPVLVEEPVQPINEEKPVKKTAVKKETAKKTAPAQKTEKKTASKPAEKKTASAQKTAEKKTGAAKTSPKAETVKTAKDDDNKVYHISKRKEDKKWQVKAEGSSKALKLFFTQEEAIDYAKSVAGNQEGRIVIHKEDGGFRKLKY